MTTISELNQQFIEHAQNNNLEGVKLLLAQGANIDCSPSLLIDLLYGNQLDLFRYLVEQGAFIHSNNDSVLEYCAKHKHLDLFQLLLSYGANLRTEDDICFNIFCEQGNLDMVKFYHEKTHYSLINQGFKLSCLHGHLELFNYFLTTGISIGDKNNNINIENNNVIEYVISGRHIHLVKWIIEHYIFDDKSIQYLLNTALKHHFVEVFELYSDYDLSFISKEELMQYLNTGNKKYTAVLKHIFLHTHHSKFDLFDFIASCLLNRFRSNNDKKDESYFQIYGFSDFKGFFNKEFNADIFSFLLNLTPEYKKDFFQAFHSLKYALLELPIPFFKPIILSLIDCGMNPNLLHQMLIYNIEPSTESITHLRNEVDDHFFIDFFDDFQDLGMNIHMNNNALLVAALKYNKTLLAEHIIYKGGNLANAIHYASLEDQPLLSKYQLALTLHEDMELREESSKLKL